MDPTGNRRLFIFALVATFATLFAILVTPFSGPHPPTQKRVSKGNASTILIVINTTFKNYNTRMKDIRNTWMKRVEQKPSMDIMFIGSGGTETIPRLVHSQCKVGYWEDSCKRGDLITFSYDFLRTTPGRVFDWVFFADDDVYIFPDNLQRMIMSLGPDAVHESKVWGIPGCAHDKCSGLCGGGGYFTNRETLFRIEEGVDRSRFENLRNETDLFDIECGRCGDLVIARVIKDRRGIPIVEYPAGSYTWDFADGDVGLIASLKSTSPLPWLYHYPAKGRMEFIHQKGLEFKTNVPLD